jgi:type IV secretory pathway VirB2 component (pilin)
VRALKIALLLAGLALSGAVTLAQTSDPQPPQAQTSNPQPSHPQYSPDGLYNLANSYARVGKPGLAVLNYERAALLAPDDDDINANLDYVRASAHIATEPRSRLTRIALAVRPLWGAWIAVVGIALVGLGLLAGRIARRFRWARIGGILTGAAFIALPASNAMLLWPRMHEAVVLVDQTPVRVAPVPMGDTAFMLPEAETVTITAEHEDFALIRTRRGLSGWVARASIGAVVP